MQVTISANGKNIQVEMSEEQLNELGFAEDKPETGYERAKYNDKYYYVGEDSDVRFYTEGNDSADGIYYNIGNYYNSEIIADNNARADKLLCCLRQWQALNDKVISQKDWQDGTLCFYNIKYNYSLDMLYAHADSCCRCLNNIYFRTREKAEEAIKTFRDELEWYFTEYIQRLDEAQNG